MDIIIIFIHFIIIIAFYLQRATTMKISRMSSLCQNQVLWSVSCRKSIIIISCNNNILYIIIKRERRASHIIIIILLCSSIATYYIGGMFPYTHGLQPSQPHLPSVWSPQTSLFSTFIALTYIMWV